MHTLGDLGRIYRIGELAKELDRRPMTIKRWESHGLIPKAKRDNRGWRYYTKEDVRNIVAKVKENNYFVRFVED